MAQMCHRVESPRYAASAPYWQCSAGFAEFIASGFAVADVSLLAIFDESVFDMALLLKAIAPMAGNNKASTSIFLVEYSNFIFLF